MPEILTKIESSREGKRMIKGKKNQEVWSIIGLIVFFTLWLNLFLMLPGVTTVSTAKVEWEALENIPLDDTPLDMAITNDGLTIYILGTKMLYLYSSQERKITEKIPLQEKADRMVLSPDGERVYLTNPETKKVVVLRISPIVDFKVSQSPVIGQENAPVTLVAFLDFQCPYCANVYPPIEELLQKHPKEVKLIIKHYPLRMHAFARNAALAALAAAKQNKYTEMTTILFKNYRNLTDETVKKYAEQIGLDLKTFETALNDPALQQIVNQDLSQGVEAKVRGVPALFINGRPVKDRSLPALSKMVVDELNRSKPKETK